MSNRRIALVDADNITQAKIGAIVAELYSYGVANIRRAYGDWALLANAGNAVQRQAPINSRHYGVKGFTALLERTKLFEIFKAESGRPYVADRRNKARAPRPEV